ncbi:hypothetical protein ACLKA7_010277 [Drosophila subpalustris]
MPDCRAYRANNESNNIIMDRPKPATPHARSTATATATTSSCPMPIPIPILIPIASSSYFSWPSIWTRCAPAPINKSGAGAGIC